MISNKERRELNRKRDAEIVLARAAGKTYRELGEQYGLAAGRIRKIWEKQLRRIHAVKGSSNPINLEHNK